MTTTTVGNQTTYGLSRDVVSETVEENGAAGDLAENSDNLVGFTTVADDGTPIVYKANDHRPFGTSQYNENAES